MKRLLIKTSAVSSETTREDMNGEQKWAVGLIDGDGHIGLEWTNKEKTKWVPVLKVTLHQYNCRAIYRLKKVFGIGRVTYSNGTISYRVRSKRLWNSILLPFFDRFHLRSMKYSAVLLVKKALEMGNTRNATSNILLLPFAQCTRKRQKVLQGSLNPNLNLNLNLNPNPQTYENEISPIWQNKILKDILDLDWLAGFIEADGSFYILKNGQHGFALGQAYDRHIVAGIHRLFNVQSALKDTNDYLMLDTKNKETLFVIASAINGRLLGIKSFELSLIHI